MPGYKHGHGFASALNINGYNQKENAEECLLSLAIVLQFINHILILEMDGRMASRVKQRCHIQCCDAL